MNVVIKILLTPHFKSKEKFDCMPNIKISIYFVSGLNSDFVRPEFKRKKMKFLPIFVCQWFDAFRQLEDDKNIPSPEQILYFTRGRILLTRWVLFQNNVDIVFVFVTANMLILNYSD